MIQSYSSINKVLNALKQQLSNKKASQEAIRRYISSLILEIKSFQEQQKYHYYLLVSEIYATKFANIEQAENQLKQFDNTLVSQISINCKLRIAFFKYFQLKYKEAFKNLDKALEEIECQHKLKDNALFFFNRILNKNSLIAESKEKNNFETAFILSLVYQKEKEYIQALQEIEPFLNQSTTDFVRFQIYKQILELYECMRANSISTISISKKSLESHREDLSRIQTKNPQFEENYKFKCQFIRQALKFMQDPITPNKEKSMLKILDYKLLAYLKLKKCSKQTNSKDVKQTLMNAAKTLKQSKDAQYLQSILNYDFIKNQYKIFSIFQKLKKQINSYFFSALIQYQQQSYSNKPTEISSLKLPQKSLFFFKKKPNTFEELPKKITDSSKFLINTQGPSDDHENLNLCTFNPTSTLKSLANPQTIKGADLQIKQTESHIQLSNFEGSKMYKFNATSEGHEQRYFYVNLENLSKKPRLYYCQSKKDKSSGDNYYPLKGLTGIKVGKITETLKRKEVSKFSSSQCFALIFDDGSDRSFYVPNPEDLQRWVILLQTKVLYNESFIGKMIQTEISPKKHQKSYKQVTQSVLPAGMKKSKPRISFQR